VLAGGTAYLSVAGQGLVAVSAGKLLWQNNIEPLDESANAVNLSQPTLANGILYAAEGGIVYALDAASGLQRWWNPLPAQANPSACGQPAVAAGVVYLSCDNGYLYALNATSGASLWSYAVPGNTEIGRTAVSGGTVYVTTLSAGRDGLAAISAGTHTREWSFRAAATLNAPAIAGNVVYAVAQNGVLYARSAVTGAGLWSASLHDKTAGSDKVAPTVADGVVYALSDNAVAYAFNAKTGARLWTHQAGNALVTAPVVANGIVYFGTRSGGVAAFAAG
jgi:outer membrane protein assembly factor BamB